MKLSDDHFTIIVCGLIGSLAVLDTDVGGFVIISIILGILVGMLINLVRQ
jgi:hypothetical protein